MSGLGLALFGLRGALCEGIVRVMQGLVVQVCLRVRDLRTDIFEHKQSPLSRPKAVSREAARPRGGGCRSA